MEKRYLVVANWKLTLNFNKELSFAQEITNTLAASVDKSNAALVICPSFLALDPLKTIFKKTSIALGAQNCSQFIQGSFTGEISAQSLQEVGARYCIIGHSERRTHFNETNEIIKNKFDALLDWNITPVLCIGEEERDYQSKKTLSILQNQLEAILASIALKKEYSFPLCIAYEPVWSIGTHNLPPDEHLEMVYRWLASKTKQAFPHLGWHLLYGGGIDNGSIKRVQLLESIDGFLVGRASTNLPSLSALIKNFSL